MKNRLGKKGLVLLACALGLSVSATSFAQEKKRNISQQSEQVYVISAEAGRVNYVSGGAYVQREGEKTEQILARTDEINAGDKVSVSETGKLEVLLNPGSFLRLAENTYFQFTDTSLENLQMKLARGSALIEAVAVGGRDGAEIIIATPHAGIRLEKSGIYRINVTNDNAEVFVWKGAATVGNEVVKAGRKAVFKRGSAETIAKFDKDEKDALDIWSKDRAKEMAKLNDRLQRRELSRAFQTSAFNNRTGYGYWVFNRLSGNYSFVPFGWYGWGSPYGYTYNYNVYYYPNDKIRRLIVGEPIAAPVYGNPNKAADSAPPMNPPIFAPPPPSAPVYTGPAAKQKDQ